MLKMFKEQLNGKYDGVAPATLIPVGGLSGGKNIRKVSGAGGWKARKGATIHNTTLLASAGVLSLHTFKHPRLSDYHFIAQCNGNLYDASGDPPAAGGSTFAAAALSALASSTIPGFSDVIGENWLYADGDSAPIMWGGDGPYCTGFAVWDNSEGAYIDYTRVVQDGRSDTGAVVLGAASDVYYVCSPCIATAITLDLGTGVNTAAATASVWSWIGGAWATERTIANELLLTDSTRDVATSTKTHAKGGTLSWAATVHTMRVINGIMGYWYKVSFSGALSNSIDVVSCNVVYAPAVISNKWSGVYEYPTAVRFFDQSAGEYVDYTGKLRNESTAQYIQLDAATTSDELLIKSAEPLCGIGFGVVDGYEQTAAAKIDQIEDWDGDSYNAITTGILDETLDVANDSSFAQTGVVWWNAAGRTVKRRTQEWDSTPGYWYKVTWNVALDGTVDDCRVFMVVVATFPEALPAYKGVVEFKNRTFIWPDPEFPNRLRFSAAGRPDCFSGSDSGYTDEFGDKTPIVAAKRFYNELIVWKANSVWLLEGFAPQNLGIAKIADTVGCCAPKTALVIETGFPTVHQDEPLSIAIWADTDGIYILDGRKPKKVSMPVDQYFNTEYATAIAAASLSSLQAYIDKLNNEYHLLLQSITELVFNFVTDEWYPPWIRRAGDADDYLVCGINLKGTDNRDYCYAGNNDGLIFRLENDTTDKSEANADVAIEHSLKSRAISAQQEMATTLEFTFRKAFIEAKARASGTVTTNFYKNMASAATVLTVPAAISLVNSGYALAVDGIETNQTGCKTFQLEFVESTADVELEIYSFLYQLEARGEFNA